ncbi:FAD-dependent oxidoreductase [Bradyrhizobium sp. CW10]|uniref:FAD-dependent oxidoreductase n=1 Tax=Bradyrhizobium sp. CW10 TaxID=2782683 RepID=UPI001FF96DC7|nr:FAD-dependent oxidoreductase [Bradyrhizobium sp. CW10]MCK1466885.1 FAD-dependent oxidoreductase [Bradyrhizobium sp. CW10]
MTDSSVPSPDTILGNYRLPKHPLYLVGVFARGVTVYSQQIRAFNLTWALVEQRILNCKLKEDAPDTGKPASIAIIGGGFAGLTAAAALIKKGVDAEITIFEQRDTLVPLQHGSDTRWLHPRIYDWPAADSESAVADLPLLNWTAARASDVAAQILLEWSELVEPKKEQLTVYCNAQHLQIHEGGADEKGLIIEWVGDKRNYDGSISKLHASVGETKTFDHVIMAVGYGLEKDNSLSYWRNDILGQPSLAEPRRTYLVSGQGDGAMIEVLRLRISQYRQDRILDELIVPWPGLFNAVKALQNKYPEPLPGMFAAFEALERDESNDFAQVCEELTRRLRRDTDVILHLHKRRLAELFDDKTIKIAFQNRLLLYLLYKCGGFVPTFTDIEVVAAMHGIPETQIIRRHGAERDKNLQKLLSETLQNEVKEHFGDGSRRPQSEKIHFTGGYFGFPGSREAAKTLGDEVRQGWRKEYLPGPTGLAALSICTAVAGLLLRDHQPDKRLRVTLHRTRTVGEEPLLQQCCEYVGTSIPRTKPSAGRTFPVEKGTIGLAYDCREIIRSAQGVSPETLRLAMETLDLNVASRRMSSKVGFLMAMPIVQPEAVGEFSGPSPVAGVLYIDSEQSNYFIGDERIKDLVAMVELFARDVSEFGLVEFRRIRNRSGGKQKGTLTDKVVIPPNVAGVLETIKGAGPPRTSKPFQLNFDYVDFVPA